MAGGSRLRQGSADLGRAGNPGPGPHRAVRCPGAPGRAPGGQSPGGMAAGGQTKRPSQHGSGVHQRPADPEGPGREDGGAAERRGQLRLWPGRGGSPGAPGRGDFLACGARRQFFHRRAGTFRDSGDPPGAGPVLYRGHRPHPGRAGRGLAGPGPAAGDSGFPDGAGTAGNHLPPADPGRKGTGYTGQHPVRGIHFSGNPPRRDPGGSAGKSPGSGSLCPGHYPGGSCSRIGTSACPGSQSGKDPGHRDPGILRRSGQSPGVG